MTRKHYQLLAEAFKGSRPNAIHGTEETERQWEIDVRSIAHVLRSDNPLFDFDRFYQACGLED